LKGKNALLLDEEVYEGPGGKMYTKANNFLSTYKPADIPQVRTNTAHGL